jgi:hypothetical protein
MLLTSIRKSNDLISLLGRSTSRWESEMLWKLRVVFSPIRLAACRWKTGKEHQGWNLWTQIYILTVHFILLMHEATLTWIPWRPTCVEGVEQQMYLWRTNLWSSLVALLDNTCVSERRNSLDFFRRNYITRLEALRKIMKLIENVDGNSNNGRNFGRLSKGKETCFFFLRGVQIGNVVHPYYCAFWDLCVLFLLPQNCHWMKLTTPHPLVSR